MKAVVLVVCAIAALALADPVRASVDEFAHKNVLNIGKEFETKVQHSSRRSAT